MSVESIPAQRLFTVEEFFERVQDGEKADLIDGVIHMSSPDSRRNNLLGGFLYILMFTHAQAGNLGEVFASRVAFVLGARRSPEPDVAFVARERLHLVGETRCLGAPDIAVEVVAAESRERDYGAKKQLYDEAGVREYWIIDPERRHAEFHRLREGRFEEVEPDRGRYYRSEALAGFWLDTEWLWADPLPMVEECLREIRSGAP